MPVRLRLLIVWGLFAAWVGWLGWQSWRHRQFPVVSRAQLLNADVVIIAELTADREGFRPVADSKLVKVVWSRQKRPDFQPGITLAIPNLPGSMGFRDPGAYVLPLTGTGPFRIAEMPRSPLVDASRFKPQIYPSGPEVLGQIREFFSGPGGEPADKMNRQ